MTFDPTFDLSRLRSYDSETPLFSAGDMAPSIVCASVAEINGEIKGKLIADPLKSLSTLRQYLEAGYTIAFANAPYDLAVACEADPTLLPLVFKTLREGRIYDVLTAQALNDIYYGHLGTNPDGSELRSPSTGKVSKRYSLEIVTKLVTGRVDAKKNDVWRKSYALLQGIPEEDWPEDARIYPVDDANNTIEDAAVQIRGISGEHEWIDIPGIPGIAETSSVCRYCNGTLTLSWPVLDESCPKAPYKPHKNLENLPAQVEAAVALWFGACWGLRTDPERVEKLAAEVEEKHKKAVERYQKKGWIRENGTEDQAAVKSAVAIAYGATGVCARCDGTGKVRNVTLVDCRGEKIKGRYQGCVGGSCIACGGSARVQKIGNEIVCKNVYSESDSDREYYEDPVETGCDGTGLALSTAPMLPRTKKKGVCTDRDSCSESGDEDLADYGENQFEKSRSTYVPYLRKGTVCPLTYSPNVLVVTGRCSVENSPLHQMPRIGAERGCIRARGAWCGSPIEYVLGSTDYSAGELCTLAQLCYWLFSYSQMRDAINASGNPGILHSDLAAEVLGISLEEFLVRLKSKDRQAVDFRQMSKCINFGMPGRMGVAKLVLTSRKGNAGFTVAADGPAVNEKDEPGYWGVRFCILAGGAKQCGLEKITEWKHYPCPPVCKACVKVVAEMLRPAYFRRYPEIKDYFGWAEKMIKEGKPAPCAVWDPNEGAPKIIRERGTNEITAFCNNGFQGMLSDIGKHAFVRATRECYLGAQDDGLSSPLAGCRLPLYLHDEPLSELILKSAHLSGPRIAEIMMESGRLLAPDVVWKAETALAFWWNKSMEPVYDSNGKLVVWRKSHG